MIYYDNTRILYSYTTSIPYLNDNATYPVSVVQQSFPTPRCMPKSETTSPTQQGQPRLALR